jgi:hypothetical protein
LSTAIFFGVVGLATVFFTKPILALLCSQPTDLVSKLYAAHQNGQINSGFDATAESSTSFITDAADSFILDLTKTKVLSSGRYVLS